MGWWNKRKKADEISAEEVGHKLADIEFKDGITTESWITLDWWDTLRVIFGGTIIHRVVTDTEGLVGITHTKSSVTYVQRALWWPFKPKPKPMEAVEVGAWASIEDQRAKQEAQVNTAFDRMLDESFLVTETQKQTVVDHGRLVLLPETPPDQIERIGMFDIVPVVDLAVMDQATTDG